MKFYKILITLLVAALVIGFFYFLTLLSPSAVPEAPVGYVDPTKESAEILKESEALEAKFEKAAAAGAISAADLENLRKAVRLQEVYIEKARAVSSDRSPETRLTALRRKLQNLEAEPSHASVADFEKSAAAAEAVGNLAEAEKLYLRAYDTQDKINRNYWLSKYRDVAKSVELDRKIKNLQVRPMYEQSVEAEKKADAAVKKSDWKTAVHEYERAVEISRDISVKFPTSGYNDYVRIQRLRKSLDSLKSSDLKTEIEAVLLEAAAARKRGDHAGAADKYASAAARQKEINVHFPRSMHVSEEKFAEYSALSAESQSRIYAAEIAASDKAFTAAIRAGDFAKASDLGASLESRVERFRADFPKSSDITDEDLMRIRYLNFTAADMPEIRAYVLASLLPLDGGKKMLKTEVPQKLYEKIMRENPSRNKSSALNPAESITFEEAKNFCQRLGWILGAKADLPTLAEYRGAVGNLRYADIDALSWNGSNSGGETHQIATKKANDRGFFDLLGNVAEFVADGADSESCTVIGGGAQTSADSISELPVSSADKNGRSRMVGFRFTVSEQ